MSGIEFKWHAIPGLKSVSFSKVGIYVQSNMPLSLGLQWVVATAKERQNGKSSTRKHFSLNPCWIIEVIKFRLLLCAFWIVILILVPSGKGIADSDWSATLYGAVLLKGNLSDGSLLYSGLEDSYLAVLALTRRMASYWDKIDLELEGQIVKHFEEQEHWELNGLGVIRWLPFPWDKYLDTSFASGVGLSYATEIPKVEEERRGDGQTAKLLVYLMLELDVALPDSPHWSVITRIHHRSGAFGLFSGVTGASNAWGFGIKYSF